MAKRKHIVCITFDFDSMSGFIARGLTSPTPISRGEFGAVAVPRILKLLANYRVPASFFIPGFTLETYPRESRMIADAGCEIGHHGWTHRPPATLTREQEEEELARANESIKALTGSYARGYRSPSWDLSESSVELLLKHDFFYDSSMMGHDYLPYRVRQGDVVELEKPFRFGRPTKLIEMPISWSLDDYPAFRVRAHEGIAAAGAAERQSRARQLGERVRVHEGSRGLGCAHLHLPPVRDRARLPDEDPGQAPADALGRRGGIRNDGGSGDGVRRAPPGVKPHYVLQPPDNASRTEEQRMSSNPKDSSRVIAHLVAASGSVPNHPRWPLLVYPGVVALAGADPAHAFEELFDRNGWPAAWRNGIYPFHHFHCDAHEALGVYSGEVTAQFGGDDGHRDHRAARRRDRAARGHGAQEALVARHAGDRRRLSGRPESRHVHAALRTLKRHAAAIARVPLPPRDPVYGEDGPLFSHWKT